MTDEPTLQLYAYWCSMAAYRVRVALNLKGVSAEEIPINLDAGEQLAPAFLAVNPEGAVPALIEPGHAPLTQSMAILEYLEERYPEPPLLPKDLYARARVRSLAALIVSDTHPLIVPRVRTYLMTHAGFDNTAWRAWATNWVTRGVSTMEARLAADPATGRFCHGDQVTIADICLASLVDVAKALRFELNDIPTVIGIVARCGELEAFARANPKRQVGAPA
ncbi:MAG TPA: maleylacetoacetate isomerase [Caulobacteraceae bacterium]|jgi:maleylacetoacetate isomerase/maleylpyruvate isomerase